jgi:hypothetical protein
MHLYSDANPDAFEIYGNILNDGVKGIIVQGDGSNTSGEIGVMGNLIASDPKEYSDNTWTSLPFPNKKWIFADNCGLFGGTQTVFNVRSSPANYNASTHHSDNLNPIFVVQHTTGASYFDCSSYGARIGNNQATRDWHDTDYFQDEPYYVEYHYNESRYRYLKTNPENWSTSDSLFIDEQESTNIGLKFTMLSNILSSDLNAAGQKINQFNPINEIEELEKEYYTLYLTKQVTEDFEESNEDIEFLSMVSTLCPTKYGRIVHYAKAWLDIEEESDSDCLNEISNNRFAKNQIVNVTVYPNPSESSAGLKIKGTLIDKDAELKIFDIQGNVKEVRNIQHGNFNEHFILNPGVYVGQLVSQTDDAQMFKIIVIK